MYNNILKIYKIYTVLSKNDPHQFVYNYVNLPVCYSNSCKFKLILFILFLIVYSFSMHFEDEGRKWMVVIVCEKKNNFKKSWKFDILMKCSVK